MNLERFTHIIEAYGGKPEHWAAQEREAALALLQVSEQARQLQEEALKLDALLDCVPIPQARATLKQHIFTQVQPQLGRWLFSKLWGYTPWQHILRPAFIFGLPWLLGITLGLSIASQQDQLPAQFVQLTQDELTKLLESESEQNSTEWSKWL